MFVFSNLAISADGKIATFQRDFFNLGTPADRKQMQVLRKRSDAILMGASTLRTHRAYCSVRGAKHQPANVIFSHALEGISPDWPFFEYEGGRRILLLKQKLSARRRQAFERSCEVIPLQSGAGSGGMAIEAMRVLGQLGFSRLLVEGGGELMWDFASRNLIDEYHVTVTPRIVGGREAPTMVDGFGFSSAQVLNLKLARCRRLGDELYLTYRKTAKRG